MYRIDFSFSDLLAGYVTECNFNSSVSETFQLRTSNDKEFEVSITSNTGAEMIRNLGDPYLDCTGQMKSMFFPGRYLFAYGIFYPESDKCKFEAKHILFLGRTENEYFFEKPDWWVKQVQQLADFYLKSQFQDGEIDYSQYRTDLSLVGAKKLSSRQETDTISRMVYGFATAFMMTGEDRYLEAAEKGTEYLRKHMRFLDEDEEIIYWYHGVDVQFDGGEKKIFASEFGDDYDAIPAYEQIYALAGPTQTYRLTGDPLILNDIELTLNLFNRYFLDKSDKGGFFSHVDPINLSPHCAILGQNRARKNWNSVGDHAPAYLINLWLATGSEQYLVLLEQLFDIIEKHFPDYEHSLFVQERFHEDWSHDNTWGWQQDRAVIGHNLKIAWNLMRIYHFIPKEKYVVLAEKIANIMPLAGSDGIRGGWYDVVERTLKEDEETHRFVWHNRKAWWQQEQAILAYLILAGSLGNSEYQRLAREATAFYNAWFLDVEDGGIYFNVLANGLPYLAGGNERGKGSHSMSGYHSFELCYLAMVYTNLLITKQPIDLYFKPKPGGFEDNILRVAPDILLPGSVHISQVWINKQKYFDFDPENLTIKLPNSREELKVKVRFIPAKVLFDATISEVTDDTIKISLIGVLDANAIEILKEELKKVSAHPFKRLVFLLRDLQCISSAGLRVLIFYSQKLKDIEIYGVGASESIKRYLEASSFCERVTLVD